MAIQTIRRVLIWSGALRALHWAVAAATVTLLASGWLLHSSPSGHGGNGLAEIHANTAYLLLALVLVRVYLLLFGSGPAQWRDFLPARAAAAGQVVRFYLTLGRSPLPSYYAHNPLWGPLYLLLYGLLLVQFMSGLFGLAGFHEFGGAVVAVLTGGHIVAAVAHDWRGTGSDVSALINGHRIFVANPVEVPGSGRAVPLDLTAAKPGRPDETP